MEASAHAPATHSTRPLALRVGVPASLVVMLLATVAWRVPFLLWTNAGIDADEAVIGLMARHIATLQRFPVWYYGQQYMGALEAWVAAPIVALLGTTKLSLKLTALLFALLFTATSWALARRIFRSEAIALAAGLVAALGPLFLTLWSLKLRGGFVSTWALGQAVLLLALHVGQEGETPRRIALLGVVTGLAIWVNLLVAPYVFAAALYLLSRRRIVTSLRSFGFALAGLLLGAAPFWISNLLDLGATFRSLPAHRGNGPVAHLVQLWERHVPVLLGAPPWAPHDIARWQWGAFALAGLGVLLLLVRERRSLWRFVTFARRETSGAELYVLVVIGFALCTAFTQFGVEIEARYASVLYTALVPALALGPGLLLARGMPGKLLGGALLAALVAFNGWSIYRHDPRIPTQPLHILHGRDYIGDLRPLYDALQARGLDTVIAEYWFAQIISYETGERIAALTWPRRVDYTARFRAAPKKAWLFRRNGFDRALSDPLHLDLRSLGIAAREELVGDWAIVTVEGPLPAPERWTVTASREKVQGTLGPYIKPENVADRVYHSRWTTQAPQRPGQWLLIDFNEEKPLTGFRCWFGDGDTPERLRVEVSLDGEGFETVHEGAGIPAHWELPLQTRARYVRLTQLGASSWRWWSVHECHAL
ncbi:MAG: discoidin domain-containing protein [Myxococcales bacterium]